MALLRAPNSLRFRCQSCRALFRVGLIEGPKDDLCLAYPHCCPVCGSTMIMLIPEAKT